VVFHKVNSLWAGEKWLEATHCRRGRVSGPLLDRIDLHVEVPPVKFRELAGEKNGETSAEIRARVTAARRRQQQRFAARRRLTATRGWAQKS
jgi:predicted ATPase with chaperone activity